MACDVSPVAMFLSFDDNHLRVDKMMCWSHLSNSDEMHAEHNPVGSSLEVVAGSQVKLVVHVQL